MLTTRFRFAATAAALTLVAVAGCHDGVTGPRTVAGTYALRSIDGVQVPVTTYSGADATYTIVADTIALDGTGHALLTQVLRITAAIDSPDSTYHTSQVEAYRLTDGTGIEIGSFGCPPEAEMLCMQNDTGRVTPNALLLGLPRTGGWSTWAFAKIAGAAR